MDHSALSGLAVSGQQHGLVVLDECGAVIRPAKLWCDTATAEEAREISTALGRHVPTGFTASKVRWLARHEPENWARTHTAFLPHDFINFRLTGRRCCEAGDASGTAYFDVRARAFNAEAMAAAAPDLAPKVPELIASDAACGLVSGEAAARTGLPEGLLVASGSGDNMMSALGSGATAPGRVVISLGTSGTAFAYRPEPLVDPEGLIAPFCDATGGWLPLLCVMNLTGVTETVRQAFGDVDLETMTREAARIAPGADGLLLLPYLQGERVPDLPEATGSLLGLRTENFTRGHLFRAALEGTACNLANGVARLRELGVATEEAFLVGGAARNPLWCQILAAALDIEVTPLAINQSAALGAALQAAWCDARRRDPAAEAHAIASPFIAPASAPVAAAADAAAIYRELGQRLREFTARLHE